MPALRIDGVETALGYPYRRSDGNGQRAGTTGEMTSNHPGRKQAETNTGIANDDPRWKLRRVPAIRRWRPSREKRDENAARRRAENDPGRQRVNADDETCIQVDVFIIDRKPGPHTIPLKG